jgi:hypothetical protein
MAARAEKPALRRGRATVLGYDAFIASVGVGSRRMPGPIVVDIEIDVM